MTTASEKTDANKRVSQMRAVILLICLIVVGCLIFFQLGHYSLWDDEATNALIGKAVLQTADTSVLIDGGKNIVAYANGRLIHNFRDQSTPPLPYYVTAASFWLFGEGTWSARLPFAFFGFLSVVLIAWCSFKCRASFALQLLLLIGFAGNISYILFSRQCRYYSLAVFFSVLVVICYQFRNRDRRLVWLLPAAGILLFFSNIMNFLALFVALLVDYLVFDRKREPIMSRQWLTVLLPMALFCGLGLLFWNPLLTNNGAVLALNSFWDRCVMWYWSWRDINACEFGSAGLLLLTLGVAIIKKDRVLWRCFLALFAYLTVFAAQTPQHRDATSAYDVRYIVPLIPLIIFMSARAIDITFRGKLPCMLGFAIIAFGCNLLNGTWIGKGRVDSILARYVRELSLKPTDPFTETAAWINANVPENASIWVVPSTSTYSLMFHAPRQVYAWQLSHPPQKQYEGLPLIFFEGMQPPDYIVCFGPHVAEAARALRRIGRADMVYGMPVTIDCFWKDTYRPELFWRTFGPITNYNKNKEGIYIFRRLDVISK